jgi:hypothetical protein
VNPDGLNALRNYVESFWTAALAGFAAAAGNVAGETAGTGAMKSKRAKPQRRKQR